jgi:endoglucanase
MNRLTTFLYFTFFISFELIAQVNPYQVVQDMGRGVNLGNTLSAPVEGNWAPVVYEQYFLDVKNEGFSNVRIPVDFYGSRTTGSTTSFSINAGTAGNYNGSISDFTVSQTYLNRLQTIVDWSISQ